LPYYDINSAIWVRPSTQRPLDLFGTNTAAVDPYYAYVDTQTKPVSAICEFDFLGYSDAQGTLTLTQEPYGDAVDIQGNFKHLSPGLHAMKIHEFGDLEHGCDSTGDVFNPFGSIQGNSHDHIHERRVGDCEQVQARFDRGAEYKNRDRELTMYGPNSILGRAMVIYETEDDHDENEFATQVDFEGKVRPGRQRTGPGARIGCCVIGLAQEKKEEKKSSGPSFKRDLKKSPLAHQEGFRNFGAGGHNLSGSFATRFGF